jgi:hypothetical protein
MEHLYTEGKERFTIPLAERRSGKGLESAMLGCLVERDRVTRIHTATALITVRQRGSASETMSANRTRFAAAARKLRSWTQRSTLTLPSADLQE